LNINLHIERLVLDGLPVARHDAPLVQAAVEAELSRLLTARGLSPSLSQDGALPAVRGDSLQLASESSPSQLGTQIAQAVYGGLSK
jgi:hypothetical protein